MGDILPTLIPIDGDALRDQLRLPSLSLAGSDFVGSFSNANTTLVGAFAAAG